MDMGKENENIDYIKMIISKIGLANFKNIVSEYNLGILNSISQGQFPTNENVINSLKNIQK